MDFMYEQGLPCSLFISIMGDIGDLKHLRLMDKDLQIRIGELKNLNNWAEDCNMCARPIVLHYMICLQKMRVFGAEFCEIWAEYFSYVRLLVSDKPEKRIKSQGDKKGGVEKIIGNEELRTFCTRGCSKARSL